MFKANKSIKDEFETPGDVFKRIEDLIGIPFILDLCASKLNRKVNSWIDKDINSLETSWKDYYFSIDPPHIGAFWMNPPYSDPAPWCRKAANESMNGLIIVGLLPDDRSTKWYRGYIEDVATTIYIPDKRINFVNPETKEIMVGNNRGSVVPVWTPWKTSKSCYERFHI